MFGVLIRSRGMPVGCDSTEPTDNFIRRPFTAISTSPRAATAVEISFYDLLFWVTIRRSNQLNYAPALKSIPYDYRVFLWLPVRSSNFLKMP